MSPAGEGLADFVDRESAGLAGAGPVQNGGETKREGDEGKDARGPCDCLTE